MWEKERVDGKRKLKMNAVPTIFGFSVCHYRQPDKGFFKIFITIVNIIIIFMSLIIIIFMSLIMNYYLKFYININY